MGFGFGTWIWDLDLRLGFGTEDLDLDLGLTMKSILVVNSVVGLLTPRILQDECNISISLSY